MQLDWQHLAQVVIESLAAKVAVVIAGVLAVQVVGKAWDRYRYGGWYVVITQGGQRVLNYGVSVAKSKQVQVMPEELPVFLKGKVSPYAWLNCDLDHKDCQFYHNLLPKPIVPIYRLLPFF